MATDTGRMISTAAELVRRAQGTQVFLKMAAIELRRIAEGAPDIAAQLQVVAQKLEAEAADLAVWGTDRGTGAVPEPGE